jgi:hypothetical protein
MMDLIRWNPWNELVSLREEKEGLCGALLYLNLPMTCWC